MRENSVVGFCSFFEDHSELGLNCCEVLWAFHDGESVTDFCDEVNKFLLFFSIYFLTIFTVPLCFAAISYASFSNSAAVRPMKFSASMSINLFSAL